MEKIAADNLFLLEFIVNKCIIVPCAITKETHDASGEICLRFNFFQNPPIDICEGDFSPGRNYKEEDNMKSGKSCLFALSPAQAQQALVQFDISVEVFKKVTIGLVPEKTQIGLSVIPIANTFHELVLLLQSRTDPSLTVSTTYKGCFDVTNFNSDVIGNVSVFLRLSCFGKLIVVPFQMDLKDRSVFFKDNEGKSMYKYQKISKSIKGEKKDKQELPFLPAELVLIPYQSQLVNQDVDPSSNSKNDAGGKKGAGKGKKGKKGKKG